MTPNQVVAANLIAAREELGLTQEEAAVRIERYLGEHWSKAAFSARERSVDGVRIREFTADELVAMAMAFDRPIGWFFLPTVPPEGAGLPAVDAAAGRSDAAPLLELDALIRLCVGLRDPATVNRLKSLLEREARLERETPVNPRARTRDNFVISSALDVVRGLVDASTELSQLLMDIEPENARRLKPENAPTRGEGAAEEVGYRTVVALSDEVIELRTRLEAVEQALGIGDKRKDHPDAWTHAEEG